MSPSPGAGGATARRRGGGPAAPVVVLVLGLVTTLAAVAFVLAPVRQPEVTFTWTPADGPAVALPLMPYQPTVLTATVGCAAARAGGLLLATTPPRPDPAAAPLDGLELLGTPDGVRVTSAGTELGTVALPPGDCTLALVSNADATTVALDGTAVLTRAGDLRPDVAGIFTEADPIGGLALSLTADTRFTTSPSALKLALAAACLAGLAALLAVLGRADRVRGPAVALLPHRWWRPRPVDGAVAALLGLWWVVGAGTVDDGYIAGIVRGRADNGVVGNVYRWLNAPEAPFSWIYEPYGVWAQVSAATPWLRLPSVLLGLLCWALLSRLLLPRLGRAGRRRSAPWVAAAAFATWWVPLNLGLRPEPWVAVGVLLAFLGVERAVATRRVRPLAGALAAAGATAAVTPGGLVAFAPVLAAAVPLLALLRARTDLHLAGRGRGAPLVAAAVAAPAAALLLMAADQGPAALVEAVRVRGRIGGGLPWYQEYERWAALLAPADIQGAIGRRAAVLATVAAVAGVAWVLAGRHRSGIAAGPARRLLVTLVVAAGLMTFSPTKWTQHFGGLAGAGAAALTLGLVAFGGPALRALPPAAAGRRLLVGTAGVTVTAGLVLAGQNRWPFVSGWYAPTFSTVPPLLAGVPVATLVLVAGGALAAVLAARTVWWRSAARPDPGPPRPVPSPAAALSTVLVAVLALQVLSLVRVAVTHRDGYTPAADALAAAAGDPCGLQSALLVETDPAAGTLPVLPGPALPGPALPDPALPGPAPSPAPVDLGGTALPGIAVAGAGVTPWYALDAEQRAGRRPVVVAVAGVQRSGQLAAEFARDGAVVGRVALTGGAGDDRRLLAPPGADGVRLAVDAPADGTGRAALPRGPVLTPMADVLPRGTRAILDWPVALVFPCLRPEPLPPGTAALARWRIAPPADDPSAAITYTPGLGGPFAAPRLLVTERSLPTYLRDDPTRDGVRLYRWDPVVPLRTLEPEVRTNDVLAPPSAGHLRVPALPPGPP